MKQEDKELLLKDLCARLTYGVKFRCKYIDNFFHENYTTSTLIGVLPPYHIIHSTLTGKEYLQIESDEIKPYLFPMSSMTDEQCAELIKLINTDQNDNNEFMRSLCRIEFYHINHFDYRGLIEKGLALDATGKNIY